MPVNLSSKKVIHSFPVWLPQTQTWLFNQVWYLPEHIESHVVCERTSNLDQFQLPNIHQLNQLTLRQKWELRLRTGLLSGNYSNYLIDNAKNIRADLLHSHFGHIGWSNLRSAELAGMKHIVTFYGLDVTFLPKAFFLWYSRYRDMFKRVDKVLCEGPFMANTIIEKLGCPKEKIQVHHLGVTVDKIEYKARKWDGKEPLRVLMAASFREKKGLTYALEALGRIQSRVDLEITIIGEAGQAQEKKKIISVINKHGLMPKTRLLGFQPFNVLFEEAYRNHIFLSPSVTAKDGDTEGGAPVSIIEMAATGMPVVSTRHCDIPEIIRHLDTGLLSDERDVDGIVANLNWLIDNPSEWARLGLNARNHIEKEFNSEVQGQRLAAIYNSL